MTKTCLTCHRSYPTSHKAQRYCDRGCIPFDIRSAAAKKGRAVSAQRRMARKFRQDVGQLWHRRVTGDDLMTLLQRVYYRGWRVGYTAARRAKRLSKLAIETRREVQIDHLDNAWRFTCETRDAKAGGRS